MKMLIVGAGVIGIVYGAHIAVPGVGGDQAIVRRPVAGVSGWRR